MPSNALHFDMKRHTREARNVSGVIGLGMVAIGSEVSPRVMVLGFVTVVGSLAFEGVRRLFTNTNNDSTTHPTASLE